MTEKLTWRTAQIRAAASIAKELDVTIELKADGSMTIHPRPISEPIIRMPKGGVRF